MLPRYWRCTRIWCIRPVKGLQTTTLREKSIFEKCLKNYKLYFTCKKLFKLLSPGSVWMIKSFKLSSAFLSMWGDFADSDFVANDLYWLTAFRNSPLNDNQCQLLSIFSLTVCTVMDLGKAVFEVEEDSKEGAYDRQLKSLSLNEKWKFNSLLTGEILRQLCKCIPWEPVCSWSAVPYLGLFEDFFQTWEDLK